MTSVALCVWRKPPFKEGPFPPSANNAKKQKARYFFVTNEKKNPDFRYLSGKFKPFYLWPRDKNRRNENQSKAKNKTKKMNSPATTPSAPANPPVSPKPFPSDEARAMVEDGKCTRYNGISILSNEADRILRSKGVLESVRWDWHFDPAHQLTINSKQQLIPHYLTSRGTLDFVGFTHGAAAEIWDYIKICALPMQDLPPYASAIDEFWATVIRWFDQKVYQIIRHEHEIPLSERTPELILDTLGIRDQVQGLFMRLTTPAQAGGDEFGCSKAQVQTFQLNRIHTDIVPVWTKRYITRRWGILKNMNDLVLAQEEGWWEKIVREMDSGGTVPLDSMEAYTTTKVYLPLENVLEIGGMLFPNSRRAGF